MTGLRILAACVALAAGCFAPSTVTCSDGRVCPASKVCVPSGCADGEQVKACEGRAEGAACSTTTAPEGLCRSGACFAARCGDGVLDPGESCDDHNTISGDGCSADCSAREACDGNRTDANEDCDDGNHNPSDGCDECHFTAWLPTALTGSSTSGAQIQIEPMGIAADHHHNLYVAEPMHHRISRADPITGSVVTVAGSSIGTAGDTGDGGPAAAALLSAPTSVAVDGLDNVYIADALARRIRKIDGVTGIITTLAGTGADGSSGDEGPATAAQFRRPVCVAVDGLGNVYVADSGDHRVRRIDVADGTIHAVAGNGVDGFSGDGGPSTSAMLRTPSAVAVDGASRVYVYDSWNDRVRRVDPSTGLIETIVGTGVPGYAGDGGPATAAQVSLHLGVDKIDTFFAQGGLILDAAGNLYLSDIANAAVRRIDAVTGTISTFAGTSVQGIAGDGGPAVVAELSQPRGLAIAPEGNLYLADLTNRRIRRVDKSGVIDTVVGKVAATAIDDGAAATSVEITSAGIAVDAMGNVFFTDSVRSRVRRVDVSTGIVTTVAGSGGSGFGGDGGPAIDALIRAPSAIVVNGAGDLYFIDSVNRRIRKVSAATKVISTVAGNGIFASTGDGGLATAASVAAVPSSALATNAADNLYVSEPTHHRVRRIDALSGIVTTVAGIGTAGNMGDGGLATAAQLSSPLSLAVDASGNLYIGEGGSSTIRRVDAATGIITTVVGTGVSGSSSGDGGPATQARLGTPLGLAFDIAGNLYIADSTNFVVRRVDALSHVIDTWAGAGTTSTSAFFGDGAAARLCGLSSASGVAVGPGGDVFVSDAAFIRKVNGATGIVTTVAGLVGPRGMGPSAQGYFTDAKAVVWAPPSTFVAGGQSGTVQRRAGGGWLDVVAGRYPQTKATDNLARFRDSSFGSVSGVAWHNQSHTLFLSETNRSALHAVSVVDPANPDTWTISPLTSDKVAPGYRDGALVASRFRQPAGLFFDEPNHVLYVADTGNHVIRAIDLSQGVAAATVTTIAGTPATLGQFGDGKPALGAGLYQPEAITRCGNGDLFIADTGNHRVRRVDAVTGLISTVLGDGVAASSGQGSPARSFPVDTPRGIACDALGNVFVTSTTTVRLLPAVDGVVDGTGLVQTIHPTTPAAAASPETHCLSSITVIDTGTVRAVDACAGVLFDLVRQRKASKN